MFVMKKMCGLLIGSLMLALLCSPVAVAQNPVVVELFTSEGCSSCPPADAILVELSQQPALAGNDLILLGEHVDYWNFIGWTDRFSSQQFSQRQSDYAKIFYLESVYTPQMVIDGQTQFVGNDAAALRQKISAAAKDAKPAQVALRWESGDRLHVSVQSTPTLRARVLLAITEDGLSTSVKGGENGGHTLHHAAVVRELREVGNLDKNNFAITVDVAAKPEWSAAQSKVAFLVQDVSSGKILGAAQIKYLH